MPNRYYHSSDLNYDNRDHVSDPNWDVLLIFVPFFAVTSAGQDEELPVQNSAVSHLASVEGWQTCVDGANVHWAVQQGLLWGSHKALLMNLHVAESQQLEVAPIPGSQSSPASTIPFPHICRDMTVRPESGSTRHEVFTDPPIPPCIKEPESRRLSTSSELINQISAHKYFREYIVKRLFLRFQRLGSW